MRVPNRSFLEAMDAAGWEVCGACLTRGRRLASLEALQATFRMLMSDFDDQNVFGELELAPCVCWECAAALRRIAEFKQRAHAARRALQRYFQRGVEQTVIADKETDTKLVSMSQLKEKHKSDFDYKYEFNFLKSELVDDYVKKERSDSPYEENTELMNPIEILEEDYQIKFPCEQEYKVFETVLRGSYETAATPLVGVEDVNIVLPKVEKPSKQVKISKAKSRRKLTRLKKKKKKGMAVNDVKDDLVEEEVKKSDWKCKICGQTFITRGKMTYHQRTAHGDPVLCNECGRVFSFKPTLEKHMLTHFGGVPQYPCAVCGKSFAGRAGIRSHMLHMHAPAGERYRCEPCDLGFKTQYKYRTHLKWSKRHGGVGTERHECDKCHRRYKTKQRLFEHFSYQHLGKAAHKCNICEKEISSLLSLQKHMKYVHERLEKPRTHVCETCGDAFKVSLLRQHQYIHTGERPFACDECGARFRQKGSLYTHRRLVHLKLKRPTPPAAAARA